MANAIYPLYKQSILHADVNVNLDTDTAQDGVLVSLLNGYTYSAAHQFFSAVATTQGTDQRITGGAPTVTNGTFASTGVLTWTAITGSQITNFVLYRHNSGANTTWRLVAFFDTSVTGLPVTPNGGNITLTWNASGIFTISTHRLKRNVRQIGKIGPLMVCEYRYAWDQDRRVGLIAEDVEKLLPQAVCSIDGVKRVNYPLAVSWAKGIEDAANSRYCVGRRAA